MTPFSLSEASRISASDSSFLSKDCDLCGLPIGKSGIKLDLESKTLRFCCQGCHQVYQILSAHPDGMGADFRETNLYRRCVEAGIIPRAAADLNREEIPIKAKTAPTFPSPLHLVFKVEGMWCPACSWLIQAILQKTDGIATAKIHFFSDLGQIEYFPHVVTPGEIFSKISRLGYCPSLFEEDIGPSKTRKDHLLRLGISGILTCNIMMVAFALDYGFFETLTPQGIGYLSWPLWIMATPVLFYGGWPILQKGLAGIRNGSPSMETLIAVGALSAYGYSLFRMLQGSMHLYFDSASMLVTLVLLGRYLEAEARKKTFHGIGELYRIANQKVRVGNPSLSGNPSSYTGDRVEDSQRWIPVREATPGVHFYVKAGETIPLDGRVLQGEGHVDESILTGESRPIRKRPGEETMAGSLLLDGEMALQAIRVGKESSLGQTMALLQQALDQKSSIETVADRITRWFVPGIILISILTVWLLWMNGATFEESLLRGLTVLVISCPCALGIASPMAKIAALSQGRKQGILIRNLSALEKARSIDTLIFDKTGTLTEGRFELQRIFSEQGDDQEEALRQISAVEIHSLHFLAKTIVGRAKEAGIQIQPSSSFEEWEGMGVKGRVQGRDVFVGNRSLMNRFQIRISSQLAEQASALETSARTVIFYGWEGKARGLAVFGDSLRGGTREMVRELRSRGIESRLVSGDGENTTKAIAHEAGILFYRGQVLPQEKVQIIRELREKGRSVGMVGDGMNDAPALAQADVGFSLGMGINLVGEASDFTLIAPDPTHILWAIDLSALTYRVIRQNLFLAFSYNGLAIPLAIAGFLNPLIAVLAMFASSLTVIGNALRISKARIINEDANTPRIEIRRTN